MINGLNVWAGLKELFTWSDEQTFTLIFGGLFLLMLFVSLVVSFMIDSVLAEHNLNWRTAIRPFAYWALMLIALLESIQLAWRKQGFKHHFVTRVQEVNYIAFWRNEQD